MSTAASTGISQHLTTSLGSRTIEKRWPLFGDEEVGLVLATRSSTMGTESMGFSGCMCVFPPIHPGSDDQEVTGSKALAGGFGK